MMGNERSANVPVKSVETMFRIMEHLKRENGATITEIAAELDVAKSTVHRHLATMEQNRFVVKRSDTYRLGLRFLEYGNAVRQRNPTYPIIGETVRDLAAETDERAQFFVEEHGHLVCLHRATGAHTFRSELHVGESEPIHATAGGKAILSQMSEADVRDVVSDLERYTDNTITDPEELLDEIRSVEKRGFSFNDEEYVKGLRAIGVAVHDDQGAVIGGLSLSGSKNRFSPERVDELKEILVDAVNELELQINYPR